MIIRTTSQMRTMRVCKLMRQICRGNDVDLRLATQGDWPKKPIKFEAPKQASQVGHACAEASSPNASCEPPVRQTWSSNDSWKHAKRFLAVRLAHAGLIQGAYGYTLTDCHFGLFGMANFPLLGRTLSQVTVQNARKGDHSLIQCPSLAKMTFCLRPSKLRLVRSACREALMKPAADLGSRLRDRTGTRHMLFVHRAPVTKRQ